MRSWRVLATAGLVLVVIGLAAQTPVEIQPTRPTGPVDPKTTSYQHEEFLGGTASSTFVGELGWGNTAGTISFIASEAGRPGLLRVDSSAVMGTLAALYLPGDANGRGPLPADTFDFTFAVRLNTNDTNTTVRVGLANTATGDPPADGIYVEKLAADTTWFRVTRASSVETRTDTAIATSTAWVRMRLRRVSATAIGFTLDSNAEQQNTANIPTAVLNYTVQVKTAAAAAKTLDLDYFDARVTGLSR